jgi:hypothetical protein
VIEGPLLKVFWETMNQLIILKAIQRRCLRMWNENETRMQRKNFYGKRNLIIRLIFFVRWPLWKWLKYCRTILSGKYDSLWKGLPDNWVVVHTKHGQRRKEKYFLSPSLNETLKIRRVKPIGDERLCYF